MSNEKPMGIAAKWPRVRYSAAYPTDAPEKLCFGGKPHEVRPKGPQGAAREHVAEGTSLPWGLTPLYPRGRIAGELLKKANSEVASLQGRPRIGELAFDGEYGNRFRQILQGVG